MSKQDKDESVRILLNPAIALRVKPWDVSIHMLLERFLSYLEQKPIVDMRLSGLALLTSSILYKLKVEQLFYEETKSSKKNISELTEPTETLRMPFRLQAPISDIADLLSALESLLQEMERPVVEKHDTSLFQPILESQAVEKDTINQIIESYSVVILAMLKEKQQIKFTELTNGKEWPDVVRSFIVILFLAHQGKVVLLQEDEMQDIILMGVG
ncbi:MAG: hypothetical protein QXG05_04060 [Nitrososphaerota archaeon]